MAAIKRSANGAYQGWPGEKSSPGFLKGLSAAARPVIETAMISAAAFVCAHAGWTVITPKDARASTDGPTPDNARPMEGPLEPVRSPFDPGQTAAALPDVDLLAVRMSTTPERSSAIVSFGDGAQHAVPIGAELGDGLVLSDVGATFIVVEHGGGLHRVEMKPLTVSYAFAMLGRSPTAAVQDAP